MPTPISKAYYHDIDMVTNKLTNARMHPLTTVERTALASSYNSGDEGVLVYDTTIDTFFVWDGNQWQQVGITSSQNNQITQAYNKSVLGIDITQTETDRTVTLTYRDNTTIADLYKHAHIHTQTVSSDTWAVVHNLGKFPSVSVVDSANEEVIGEVVHVNNTSLTIKFTAAFSGKAFIN
jgi:hypothetical protein